MKLHHPPHLYIDDTWYIITGATVGHTPFLDGDEVKCGLRDAMKELAQKHQFRILAWVILDDHYHLLLRTRVGAGLPRFIGQLHGKTARYINLADGVTDRQVWQNYWDTCIRTEADLWPRFNYLHRNPVKHGYASQPADWPFSSFHYYLRTRGIAWLDDCWSRYPIIDYIEGDDFRMRRLSSRSHS